MKIRITCLIFLISSALLLANASPINIDGDFTAADFALSEYDVTDKWNINMAKTYRNLAGLGYVDKVNAEKQLKVINLYLAIESLENDGKSPKNEQTTRNEYLYLAKKLKKLKPNLQTTQPAGPATAFNVPRKDDKLTPNKDEVGTLFYNLFYTKEQRWQHIGTFTADESHYNYSFTVIRNIQKKKIVCAFSGTKGAMQLLSEFWGSGGAQYQDFPAIKIMKYFWDLYQVIKEKLDKYVTKAKKEMGKEEDIQISFVGHSLGGAMATIASYDLLTRGVIKKTKNSPALITYGQPRAGNYAFASEVSKEIPIIYRHVNAGDLVTKIPACYVNDFYNCINEYNKDDLATDVDFKKLQSSQMPKKKTQDDSDLTPARLSMGLEVIATPKDFYPWHTKGLILVRMEGSAKSAEVCPRAEPVRNPKTLGVKFDYTEKDNCVYLPSDNFDLHKIYLGYKVSDFWKPFVFPGNQPEIPNGVLTDNSHLHNVSFKLKTILHTGALNYKKLKKMRKMRKFRKYK